jgi:hypothetical protein
VSPRDCLGAVKKSFLPQPGIEIMSLGWPTCKLVTNMTAPPQKPTRHSRIYLHRCVCVCVCTRYNLQSHMYRETGTSRKRKRLLTAKTKHSKTRMIFAAKHRPHLLIQEIVQGLLTAVKEEWSFGTGLVHRDKQKFFGMCLYWKPSRCFYTLEYFSPFVGDPGEQRRDK